MTEHRSKAWLLTGVRTAIGGFKKTLRSVPVEKLAEEAFSACVRRAAISTDALDGIVLGHGYQSSLAPNTARCAALAAGLPVSIPAMTVQRQCGSGMEAVNIVMKDIFLGNGDYYMAGGAESMSGVPYLLPARLRYTGPLAKYFPFGPRPVIGMLADDGLVPASLLWDPKTTHMAATAQRLADTYGISRKDADIYALRSQQLAAKARAAGRFKREIEAIVVKGRGVFDQDEHIRETSIDKLGALKVVMHQHSTQQHSDVAAGSRSSAPRTATTSADVC
ncbi:MAG: thiolase family protein, partial [Candidatus Obscuribacterales bacterium]|nr:thiolase family protein [Candidatus Obscuribacterales bacterium]